MKNLRKALQKRSAELVLVGGATAVAGGVGMIYIPAGLIAGGLLAMAGAVLSILGGEAK